MHSRVTTGSAGKIDRSPCSTNQLERRIGPQMIEGVGAYVAAANRGHAGAVMTRVADVLCDRDGFRNHILRRISASYHARQHFKRDRAN
jgi:predicted RNA-binding protein associated with RNAse of E/G family